MKEGQEYWIIINWDNSGVDKIHNCIWRNDYIDQRREREGIIFLTKTKAHASLVAGK